MHQRVHHASHWEFNKAVLRAVAAVVGLNMDITLTASSEIATCTQRNRAQAYDCATRTQTTEKGDHHENSPNQTT